MPAERPAGRASTALTPEELARDAVPALMRGDRGVCAPWPRSTSFAGMEPGRPVGGTYYLYRTLRRLDLADLEERLISALTDDQDLSDFERRLLREEVEARIERLRQEIEEEIRRRLVADRGRDAVARTLRRPLIEDVDLMHATTSDLHEMEDAIGPLTRKLAARLARAPSDAGGSARFPSHHAKLVGNRRRPGRPTVPPSTASPAGGLAPRRHQRVDGDILPIHTPVHPRHVDPVLQAAVVRFHRHHRRGH